MRSIKRLGAILLAAAAAAAVGWWANSDDYLRYMVTLVTIYATLAVSLDIMVGFTGRISGCQATFYGIGAYVTGIALMRFHFGLIGAIVVGTVAAAVVAAGLGYVMLRLTGIYFALGTMSFGIIFSSILILPVMEPITGGVWGLRGIPRPSELSEDWQYLVLFLVILFGSSLLKYSISVSHFGRTLRSIRDDEELARTLGVYTDRYKVGAFCLSGTLAGLVGAVFAPFFGYVAPSMFSIWQSFNVLVWVLIGGVESVLGPIVGASILWTFPQVLKLQAAQTFLIYGVALLVMIVLNRRGLSGFGSDVFRRAAIPVWAAIGNVRKTGKGPSIVGKGSALKERS